MNPKRSNRLTCALLMFLLTSALALGITPAERAATVNQLWRELHNAYSDTYQYDCEEFGSKLKARKTISKELARLDPVLIGTNVVFSKEWLRTSLTREQIETARNDADRIYACFVGFTGRAPNTGSKVLISIGNTGKHAAHAHAPASVVCVSRKNLKNSFNADAFATLMMHELGHIFTNETPYYVLDATVEPLANLFAAYAMEHLGTAEDKQKYRKDKYSRLIDALNQNGLPAYPKDANADSALEMYLLGLVEAVGWDAFKNTFRSYDGRTNPIGKSYQSKYRGKAESNDLLERVRHFGGRQDVLTSFPDNGRLFKRYFAAERTRSTKNAR